MTQAGRGARVVAFDVIGTLFPLDPLRPALGALGLPPESLETWFAASLRDAFALSAVGDYAPFAKILTTALAQMLATRGLSAGETALADIVQLLPTLPPRAGAREAMAILSEAGLPVMAVTNGAANNTRRLLDRGGLSDVVRTVVSSEDVQLYKPRREIYDRAVAVAGVERRDLVLVAAHPWDINGAAAAGLATAYLSEDHPFGPVMRRPDHEAPSLPVLARLLVAAG